MPEQSEKGSGYRSLEKALLLEALDLLEQEFFAFQQGGRDAHRPATSASGTLTLIDADVKRTQQLLLDLDLTATDQPETRQGRRARCSSDVARAG